MRIHGDGEQQNPDPNLRDFCPPCASPTLDKDAGSNQTVGPDSGQTGEFPFPPFATREGNAVTLRCRTPGEAYLVQKELEEADIVTLLPEEDALIEEYRRKGYVEVRVSATAYSCAADLQTVVEFRYQKLRAEEPLGLTGKAFAVGCALLPVPGVLAFTWLFKRYRADGYHRMGRDLTTWFLCGVALWILLITTLVIIAPKS
jgi:hypothetical protein